MTGDRSARPDETRAALLARARCSCREPSRISPASSRDAVERHRSRDLAAYGAGCSRAALRAMPMAGSASASRRTPRRSLDCRRAGCPVRREIIDIFSADMPFIVDSVLAAIRAKGGTIRFMAHPVLSHRPGIPPRARLIPRPRRGTRKLPPRPHRPAAPTTRRAMRCAEIDAVLGEVARAVAGWRPMLERAARSAVQDLRATPPKAPGRRPGGSHALPRLARRAQFHLPRHARISRSTGDGTGAHARRRSRTAASASSPTRTVHFLRAGTDFVEMTRAARRLPRRARAADGHQGQCPRPRPPPQPHGLCRRQALRRGRRGLGRAAHPRPLHLDVAGERRTPKCR